ncbi:hypothetical protein [Paenibacillus oleatilyticus]|uniref:Uncharacterized protein n=1 Tax=Paenibacillus oleatilyticus TaxID=2594886 RepID=A0ABV4VA58_9BACL
MEKTTITKSGLKLIQDVQYFISKASTDMKGIAYRMSLREEGNAHKKPT